MSKTNKTIILNLLSISLIITAFLGSVNFWCYNLDFYKSEHNSLTLYDKSISEHIGISDNDLDELTSFVLDYLNDKHDSLDKQMLINGESREVFTNDEKVHMVDVKVLNLNARYILIISSVLIVLLSLILYIKKISIFYVFNTYKKVLLYSLLFFSIIGFWILIDFDSFWTIFHKVFFSNNDLWLLDLRKDVLIMIVPPDFFNHLVIRILISFVLLIGLIYLVLYLLNRRRAYD